MNDIRDAFSKKAIREWKTERGIRYFDPLRKIFVPITPEELIRQRTIVFLQENIGVPAYCMHSEEHLAHYGIDYNGRMDIVINEIDETGEYPIAVVECKKEDILIDSDQVIEQALNYSVKIGAKYFMVVNGISLQYYRIDDDTFYPIQDLLTYQQMLSGLSGTPITESGFERLDYNNYFDIEALMNEPWIESKIGADTKKTLIPYIINLDDCLLDVNYRIKHLTSSNFELIEDVGTQLRQYNDASGGGFGTGIYRSFIVKDKRNDQNLLIGFSIMTTGKTVNDPKYGNTDGKSVLVIMVNDGDTDEMSVQINMNQYLYVTDDRKIRLTHNGAVTRKGAKKEDLFAYIENYTDELVTKGKVDFGLLNCAEPLTMNRTDVIAFISKLIEYAVYRNEYKKAISRK